MSLLILFDVDGTLVNTGGAGRRAMARAFRATLGLDNAMAGVPLAGRTDEAIIVDVLERTGAAAWAGNGWRRGFETEYFRALVEELSVDSDEARTVLPGVAPLLDALERSPGVTIALLTGNFRASAEIKLAHFDLWRRFAWGAFGGETRSRNDLLPIALRHAAEHGLPPFAPREVVIVGDTTYDVACAHGGGARCLAVATGGDTSEALRAAGADLVLDDLADTATVLDWLWRHDALR